MLHQLLSGKGREAAGPLGDTIKGLLKEGREIEKKLNELFVSVFTREDTGSKGDLFTR